VTLKIGLKARSECTLEKIDDEKEGKLEQKFDVAFGTIFRTSKGFQRSKQKLYLGNRAG
jgi:hypothetical protein